VSLIRQKLIDDGRDGKSDAPLFKCYLMTGVKAKNKRKQRTSMCCHQPSTGSGSESCNLSGNALPLSWGDRCTTLACNIGCSAAPRLLQQRSSHIRRWACLSKPKHPRQPECVLMSPGHLRSRHPRRRSGQLSHLAASAPSDADVSNPVQRCDGRGAAAFACRPFSPCALLSLTWNRPGGPARANLGCATTFCCLSVTLDEIRCSSARRVRKPRLVFQQS
jgi:hypothetical protein